MSAVNTHEGRERKIRLKIFRGPDLSPREAESYRSVLSDKPTEGSDT